MSPGEIYQLLGVALFVLGALALALRPAVLQRLLAVNVMGVGVFMWLVAAGYHPARSDSVPHALVLTGIVVAVSATGFALALLVRIAERDARDESRRR
jgi:multicomponent Na+:H+ antiporter subunit C